MNSAGPILAVAGFIVGAVLEHFVFAQGTSRTYSWLRTGGRSALLLLCAALLLIPATGSSAAGRGAAGMLAGVLVVSLAHQIGSRGSASR